MFSILRYFTCCFLSRHANICEVMSRCPMITPYVRCLWDPKIDCYNFGCIWLHYATFTSCQDPPQPSSVKPPEAGKDTDLSGRWWERLYGRIWQIGQNVSVLIVTGWGTATLHIWWRAGPNPIILHFSCLGMSGYLQVNISKKSIYPLISYKILWIFQWYLMSRCVKICQDAPWLPHVSVASETPR